MYCSCALILALLTLPGQPLAADVTWPVEEYRNLSYQSGPAGQAVAHQLDLLLPKGKKEFPVVLFLHGGAWTVGDKSWGGKYTNVGRCLARHGIGAVLPNYRLAPAFPFPAQIDDAAQALAWTVKNIGRYGGTSHDIILCGHSAGGHLAALLATDPTYMKRAGVERAWIKGVICVSGVYQVPEMRFQWQLPWNQAGTIRVADFGFSVNPFREVFGDNPEKLRAASPLSHVHRGLPPFLLINADHDFPLLPGMTREFATALRHNGVKVETLTIPNRNHESVMFDADTASDPCMRAILAFIRKHGD